MIWRGKGVRGSVRSGLIARLPCLLSWGLRFAE